jgi:hypothetical protein
MRMRKSIADILELISLMVPNRQINLGIYEPAADSYVALSAVRLFQAF